MPTATARPVRQPTKASYGARRSAIPAASPAQLSKYFADKLAAELGPPNLKRLLDEGASQVVVLDVRSREGFDAGHVPGAAHIPFEELPRRLKELPKGKSIVTYCWDVTCLLATKAAYVLASKGYRPKELLGGIEEWRKAGFPVEK